MTTDIPQQPRPTFRKHERLTGVTRIKEVVVKGRSVHVAPFKLVGRRMVLPTSAAAQVAFAVPKRHLRHAVQRNRMKRMMREAYRLNKARYHALLSERGAQCAWLFIHQSSNVLSQAEVTLKITRALDRWMEQHG